MSDTGLGAGAGESAADASDMPDSHTVHLAPPITFNGGSYARLELREPKQSEYRQAATLLRTVNPESIALYQEKLVSLVANVPVMVVNQLRVTELAEAAGYLQRFIDKAQRIGSR